MTCSSLIANGQLLVGVGRRGLALLGPVILLDWPDAKDQVGDLLRCFVLDGGNGVGADVHFEGRRGVAEPARRWCAIPATRSRRSFRCPGLMSLRLERELRWVGYSAGFARDKVLDRDTGRPFSDTCRSRAHGRR